jgi:UPF0271 protein
MKLINCDLGECLTPDPDPIVMPLIDMANIASGGHVGDESSIEATLRLAKQHGVEIGIHPSYEDQINFGRLSHDLDHHACRAMLSRQIERFSHIAASLDLKTTYIKPHGALYHDMMHDTKVLDVICDVMLEMGDNWSLVVQAGLWDNAIEDELSHKGIQLRYEAFADRRYIGNQLAPRSEPDAVLTSPEHIINQYQMLNETKTMKVDTICFHSDNPASIEALKQLRQR